MMLQEGADVTFNHHGPVAPDKHDNYENTYKKAGLSIKTAKMTGPSNKISLMIRLLCDNYKSYWIPTRFTS